MPRQPYAPTPHSYVPNSMLSATINLLKVRSNSSSIIRAPHQTSTCLHPNNHLTNIYPRSFYKK
ncbi:hypothetical protein QBC38DRAFT_474596 [Podospora fimiseda]|uniref:Uncharacterized protein n=1 Tax=Podospora fimiseda TaxID=252190 RepID=A0AAN7BSB5_9PEZI|nr:hypothetical protein QBC38DRAFT_474596 [Podospora fimiseda]